MSPSMAALTFFNNSFYSDPSLINPQFHHFSPEFPSELLYFPPTQLVPDPAFDYLAPPLDDSVFYPTAPPPFFDDPSFYLYPDVCPYFSAPLAEEFAPVSAEFYPFDDFELHCPKRQRVVLEQSCCGCGNGSGGNVGGEGGYLPPPEMFSGFWDGGMDNAVMMNNGSCSKTKPSLSSSSSQSNNNLPAQTIAARERRRKITAKTQELGELVPGGSKMNTAEMLSSAFKYVKFLQAQVAILELKQDTEQEQEETEDLQILESSTIQEKLYSEEQCLVPKGFVQNLVNVPEIQSHPSIFNSINEILQKSS